MKISLINVLNKFKSEQTRMNSEALCTLNNILNNIINVMIIFKIYK